MDFKKIDKVPFQVQTLIHEMLNEEVNVHLRGNYRLRLDEIQHVINTAIKKYDLQVASSDSKRKKL